ncbi:syntabulin isoform X1 [Dermochelys coriacea]|uniref:syntabulin isoform X1 n=1 Tax=Dermochelys coriacea TaxID=27794 RepID=UPI0018E8D741|nr:syntabulin isoform X1 [Dermochelys coriacea]
MGPLRGGSKVSRAGEAAPERFGRRGRVPGGGPRVTGGQEQKLQQEKEISRSRIPRLLLRPYVSQQQQQQQKVSPASESPFSEEESRQFNPRSSSGGSARTISSNSFCSDDTGCPSSQSVSPVKTPSDAGNSPISFCTGSDGDYTKKKCNAGMVGEGNPQSARYKKETKTNLVKPGSEADFSSSSSTGSISAPEVHVSVAGSKRASFSRNRGPHGRNNGSSSYKSGTSPPTSREKDLLSVLCRNQLSPVNFNQNYGASSASSSNSGSYKGSDSSPVMRRSVRYTSCGENHGIKAPHPEQYLTPLQQKEVTVRHLKTKLKESESKLQEREAEIEELKSQLARMREDWIEEECHRVEAQLALKEARKEIKQLKQVIETMKNSLAEKDKGIQKYFIDINIQNKKLESLLHSMEMAQSGSLRDEQCIEYTCESPGKSLGPSTIYSKMVDSLVMEDQAMEDSRLLLNDDMANGTDFFEEIILAATPESGDPALFTSTTGPAALNQNALERVCAKKLTSSQAEEESDNSMMMEQAIQTDVVPYSPDVEQLLQNIFRSQHTSPMSPFATLKGLDGFPAQCFSESALLLDLNPSDPNSAILLSPMESPGSKGDWSINENRVMKELDFTASHDETFRNVITLSQAGITKRYWSSSFLLDLLAVAAPIVPTVMWAFSTQRGGTDPVYNICALLRGCCLVTLHSLRCAPFSTKT